MAEEGESKVIRVSNSLCVVLKNEVSNSFVVTPAKLETNERE